MTPSFLFYCNPIDCIVSSFIIQHHKNSRFQDDENEKFDKFEEQCKNEIEEWYEPEDMIMSI